MQPETGISTLMADAELDLGCQTDAHSIAACRYDGIVQKLKWNVSARELRKLPSLKKPHYEENGASWDSCPID